MSPSPTAPNIVLVVLDDLGPRECPLLGVPAGHITARMPFLSTLADSGGRLFGRHYGEAACSPTRADLLTGLFPHDHGVGEAIKAAQGDLFAMDPTLWTWPRSLSAAGWRTACFGKWHLAHTTDPAADAAHPIACGFETFRGTAGNFGPGGWVDPSLWTGLEEAPAELQGTMHATERTAALALDWFRQLPEHEAGVAVLNFHAPHEPFEPALEGHTREGSSDLDRFLQLAEQVDSQLARFWWGLPAKRRAQTLLLVTADNGSPELVQTYGTGFGKGTLYEGGIRSWLLAYREQPAALPVLDLTPVCMADYAATILELCGVQSIGLPASSISFAHRLGDGLVGTVPTGRLHLYAAKRQPLGVPHSQLELLLQAVTDVGGRKLWRRSFRRPDGTIGINEKLLDVPTAGGCELDTERPWSEEDAAPLRAILDSYEPPLS